MRNCESIRSSNIPDLSQEEEEILRKRGYDPDSFELLGKGKTRKVYKAQYKKGDSKRDVVVKIPLKEEELDSPHAIATKKRRDIDFRETDLSNRINCPYVVDVKDSFMMLGRRVNVEPFYDVIDLEEFVRRENTYDEHKKQLVQGRISSDKEFRDLASKLIEGALYLEQNNILHRDLKPSNVLIGNDGSLRISDLQTAAHVRDISEKTLPTRGGARFQKPKMLNSLFSGHETCADPSTEVHSIGCILYYVLTGKDAFDYNIVQDPEGKKVDIDGRSYRFSLHSHGKKLESISEETHEKELFEALKTLPKKYRNLLFRCMTTDYNSFIKSVSELKSEFERTHSWFVRFKERLMQGARYILPTSFGVGIGSLMLASLSMLPQKEHGPTMAELLDRNAYHQFNLNEFEDLNDFDRIRVLGALVPYMENARKRISEIEKDTEEIDDYSRLAKDFHKIPKRLSSSLLRTFYLNQKEIERLSKLGNKRLPITYVPEDFAVMVSSSSETHPRYFGKNQQVAMSSFYLKSFISPDKDVADVFAYYFASDEIPAAMIRSESRRYLPYTEPDEKLETLRSGYRKYISPSLQNMIDTAIAIYYLTDEEGRIHWDKKPKFDFNDKFRYSQMQILDAH